MSVSPSAGGERAGDNIARGIALTVFAVLVFGLQDAVAKVLVQDYSPFQIVMMRYWAFALFSLVLVVRQGPLRQAFRSRAPWWQMLRGVLLVIDIWLFATAVRTVPLAELQAVVMVYPLLVTLFAIPLLGERVGLFRFAAVVAGFAGALVIVRPGGVPLDWGVGFAVLSATAYALYIVITRKVAQFDTSATNMVYAGVIGLVLTTAVGLFYWKPMDLNTVLLTAFTMVTTCVAHGAMVVAMSYAPASVVQPFNYLALPWAIALSVVVFHHLIDPISLAGAAIIVGAGLVVMARERIRGSASASVAETPPPGKE